MKPNNKPLVSIVIPVYNGSNYLKEAIDSALAQTYKNIEVLVINDGSRDEGKTREIALSYGNRIRYFEKENGGVATALNLGISEMQGEYFSWLSHDDLYDPRKVEIEVEAAMRFDEPVVVYSNVSVISEGEIVKQYKILPQAQKSMRCFLALDITTGLNGCSLLIPREAFEECGVFNPELRYTQDYDLWFRISEKFRFEGVEEQLVLSRSHPEQDTKKFWSACETTADSLRASLVEQLSTIELEEFIGDDFFYIQDSYHTYKGCKYFKTSQKILSAMAKIHRHPGWDQLKTELIEQLLDWPRQDLKPIIENYGGFGKNRKKRILIYCNVFVVGGTERVISVLAGQFLDDYDIILVSGEYERTGSFPLPPGVHHLKIRNGNYDTIPERLTLLCSLLEIDLFIGCPNIVLRFLDVYPMLREAGVKTIAWNHYFYFLPFQIDWMIPVGCKRNDIYKSVSASVWLTSFSTSVYSQINDNGALIPNPVTFAEEPDPADIDTRKEKIVLAVGRFYDSVKRIDLMLEAFQRVLTRVPDAKLVLVGEYNLDAKVPETNDRTVREMLKQLGLDKSHVQFVGETENVRKYYQKASALIMTSDSEGFGLVMLEAAHFGIPTILFEIPGVEDLISDGENGYIIPRYDFDGMADKIAAILNNNDLRRELGRNAQKMSRRFSHDLIGRRWKDLIKTVLAYEDQDELNDQLAERFGANIQDNALFARQAVRCGEEIANRLARSLISHNRSRSNFCDSLSDDDSQGSDLELERIKSSVYFKAYEKCRNKPILRFIANAAVKPALRFSWHVYKKTRGWTKQLRIW